MYQFSASLCIKSKTKTEKHLSNIRDFKLNLSFLCLLKNRSNPHITTMDDLDKLPFKRVELSLTKFNEVAIPHHLELLRQHRTNIIKYSAAGAAARVRSEQAHAARECARLRALLAELQALRRRLRAEDRARFDRATRPATDLTLRAIMDYLETSPMAISRPAGEAPAAGAAAGSAVSTDSVGVVAHAQRDGEWERERPWEWERERERDGELAPEREEAPLLQLRVDESARQWPEASLEEREATLRGWRELQREVRALHDAWRLVHEAALAQRDQVATSAVSVEVAADNVQAARSHLLDAERLRAVAAGASGAALGALVGGPVGLVLGAKAAAGAALAGSLLGYGAARLWGRRLAAAPPGPRDPLDPLDPRDPLDPLDRDKRD